MLSGFQVVLEDTLLFPEGGGQVLGAASAPPKEPPHSSSLLQKMRSPFLSLSKSEGLGGHTFSNDLVVNRVKDL